MKECSLFQEIAPELIQAYTTTFLNRFDCYPLQLPDGKYCTLHKPLTTDLLIQHIKGEVTLGTYALNADSQARWLCLDADMQDTWLNLWTVAKTLEQIGLTPYIELSRRGGHLWLFTPAIPGKDIR